MHAGACACGRACERVRAQRSPHPGSRRPRHARALQVDWSQARFDEITGILLPFLIKWGFKADNVT